MKLDWQLVRTILAHVEAETIEVFLKDLTALSGWREGQLLSERLAGVQDQSQKVVLKHIRLLANAGYIEGIEIKESIDRYFSYAFTNEPTLTLSGYSLLESLRTDKFIDKLRAYAKEKM